MTLRLSVFMLCLLAVISHAQSTANTNGSAAITLARMRPILQGMGLEFNEEGSGDSAAFTFSFNGQTVRLLPRSKGIQLSSCFGYDVAPLKENQWNREHFSTRAYMDEQGCAALGADVNFGGSFSNAMIEEFIREFLTSVTIHARFVAERPPAPISASPVGPMAWSQSGQKARSVPPGPEAAEFVPGLLKINPNFSLRYDPDLWRQTAPGKEGQIALEHRSGEGNALVIAERIAVPPGSVEDVALANAQTADPKAQVVFRQQRRINGADVRFLKINAGVNAVPMVYWGCFYGGEYGTVQVVTYTTKTLLPEYDKDFMDLLSGLIVAK